MKVAVHLSSCFAVCLTAMLAHAQGGVIGVGVSNDKLVVSNGVADNIGFADQVFVETGTEGWPTSNNISGFGPSYLWMVPGIHISGMAVNSGLYIETVARPVGGSSPPKDRVLWNWNPTTGTIQDVSPDNHFLIYKLFAGQGIFLEGTDSTAPPALKIAAPQANDLNFDNYGGLARFALHREVPPPAGVYAVFARFTSDEYQPSDPFLLTFNNGQLTGSQMTTGALAINAAAVGGVMQNGDFNHDSIVDAADYTVWRDGLGSTYTPEHYGIWKKDFGQTFEGAGSTSVRVPEPAFQAPLALLVLLFWSIRGCRTLRRGQIAPMFAPSPVFLDTTCASP